MSELTRIWPPSAAPFADRRWAAMLTLLANALRSGQAMTKPLPSRAISTLLVPAVAGATNAGAASMTPAAIARAQMVRQVPDVIDESPGAACDFFAQLYRAAK